MCPDHYSVVSAVELVLNQRLLRRLCRRDCAGQGCAACRQTGYRSRVPAVEWLCLEPALRTQLRSVGPEAITPPHRLEHAARELLRRGLSDAREYERVLGRTPEPADHRRQETPKDDDPNSAAR